jgi:hypothetical protein
LNFDGLETPFKFPPQFLSDVSLKLENNAKKNKEAEKKKSKLLREMFIINEKERIEKIFLAHQSPILLSQFPEEIIGNYY